MYEDFFGFHAKPFELLPNPDFLFLSQSHRRALKHLEYGIRSNAGFILMTGEIGAGKTTIIRDVIKRNKGEIALAKVFNTKVESLELLSAINEDFGLESGGKSRLGLLRDLNDFLIEQYAQGQQAVLIVDEAQNLSAELLEEVRMLSNLETADAKLLQIVLVGQPELLKVLDSKGLRQLRQRISVNCHLSSLSREECKEYIHFRLDKAGNKDALSFEPEALDIIHELSRGIPRLINILCEYLLIEAFTTENTAFTARLVRDIAEQMRFREFYWESQPDGQGENGLGKAAPRSERITRVLLSACHEFRSRLESIEGSVTRLRQLIAGGGDTESHAPDLHEPPLASRLDSLERGLAELKALHGRDALQGPQGSGAGLLCRLGAGAVSLKSRRERQGKS